MCWVRSTVTGASASCATSSRSSEQRKDGGRSSSTIFALPEGFTEAFGEAGNVIQPSEQNDSYYFAARV
jgi:hypothetical protein